ncbi:MAG: pyridoxamine 5'-phosphate oxidase family protein [Halobacteria archaeon]|nr:pyridoxamine 5'-phosphate oxidase family protein [Halobacteria archaeon]
MIEGGSDSNDTGDDQEFGYRRLSDDEVEGLLGKENVGVLALNDDGVPYAFPMSYGYGSGSFFFEFGNVNNGRKAEIAEAETDACFTVHSVDRSRWGNASANTIAGGYSWASVIAVGKLIKVEDDEQRDGVDDTRTPSPAYPWGEVGAGLAAYELETREVSGRGAGDVEEVLTD